jgi:predicted N-acetyltransferase YhbS
MADQIEIRELLPGDTVDHFESGSLLLDDYFVRFAKVNHRGKYNKTEVALISGVIVGYITTLPSSLKFHGSQRPRNSPEMHPMILVGRLAVSMNLKRQGIGRLLMNRAFERARKLREAEGCSGVYTEPKLDAIRFYEKLGFVKLEGQPTASKLPAYFKLIP